MALGSAAQSPHCLISLQWFLWGWGWGWGWDVILLNICSLKQLRKQLKKKKKISLPPSATPQIQKQNKNKPKITTATVLPLQQACPHTATKPTPTLQIFDS